MPTQGQVARESCTHIHEVKIERSDSLLCGTCCFHFLSLLSTRTFHAMSVGVHNTGRGCGGDERLNAGQAKEKKRRVSYRLLMEVNDAL